MMMGLPRIHSLVFIISIFFLNIPYNLSSSPSQLITSCLTHYNINNFTTIHDLSIINNHTQNDDQYYYKLLNFSIQNLRFANPAIPKPIAIILPETKRQLAKSVLCCRKSSLEIRTRCGGHNYEGTSAVVTDGSPFAIIDMINLNRVLVDLPSETAWVEGGATLGEIYYSIARLSDIHGFSAGSCPTVGVGGHISGGGFGLMSRKFGVAADNVVDAILVDGKGRFLDREGMGEDVFWAIRGGGGGVFGIVYAWKIKLVKVPRTVTSFIVSRPKEKYQVEKLVNKWQYVAPYAVDDFYLTCFVGASLPEDDKVHHGNISSTFKGFYLGSKDEFISILNRVFPELGITEEDCNEMSWIESIVYFSGLKSGSSVIDLKNRYFDGKKYFKAKSDFVRSPIPYKGIRNIIKILEKQPKGYVILDPYGGIMDNISSESIAFPHRKGNLFSIQYLVVWYEEDIDRSDYYIKWIRRFYDAMTSYVSCGPRAAYINYMDIDLGQIKYNNDDDDSRSDKDAVEIARVWGEKYFLKNYDRLVKAKSIIDPTNIFRHQQGIPPSSFVGLQAMSF